MAEVELKAYLVEVACRPFCWQTDDCATFVLNWFDRLSMKPRAHLWRDSYHDAESCTAFIATLGGFEKAAEMFLTGWYGARRAAAAPGNAVVCKFREVEAMGIRMDDIHVALRTERGLLITHRAKVAAEWGLA